MAFKFIYIYILYYIKQTSFNVSTTIFFKKLLYHIGKVFVYILYQIVYNKFVHLFHYIEEALYYPSNYTGKQISLIILQNICLAPFS